MRISELAGAARRPGTRTPDRRATAAQLQGAPSARDKINIP